MRRVFFIVAMATLSAVAAEIKVDFSKDIGPIKPVNAVGQPPMVGMLGDWGLLHYLKDAGIPYSRLHDVGGWLGGGLFVDVPNLFPDFDADENDLKSYRFAYTDDLISALVKNECEPWFRLGITIENWVCDYWAGYHALPALRTAPPKDFAKWARICEHIIRHYTEGWANGFRYKITYWEIWNEADLDSNPERSMTWGGTFDEYCRFYGVAASHLKKCFPHLKIGGPASCGLFAAVNPMAKPRSKYYYACVLKFLGYVRDNKLPLDFFSFHSYSVPDAVEKQVFSARKLLDEYGFTQAETWLNEWLCYVGIQNLGTALQSSGIAAEMLLLQNSPLTGACIYDARCGVGDYSPLFNALTQKPHKAYYVFTAFNELVKCGTSVAVETDGTQGLRVVAARGRDGAAIMFVNHTDKPMRFKADLGGRKVLSCRVTDGSRTDAETMFPDELTPFSFYIARLSSK